MATILTTTYDSVTNSNALTITLASLPTSPTLVLGRESTVVDNTSNNYIDYLVRGQVTTLDSLTLTAGKQIMVYAYAPLKVVGGTFTYPVATATALTAVDAAATFEIEQLNQLRLAAIATINATNNRAYSFAPFSIASLFGGVVPLKWGLFVTQNSGQILHATAGNHWFHWTGIKYTST